MRILVSVMAFLVIIAASIFIYEKLDNSIGKIGTYIQLKHSIEDIRK